MKKISLNQTMFSKVPEITLYFWIIKIICTTVGETAADFLNTSLHVGLTGTSLVMGTLLIMALIFQFLTKQYRPAVYWVTVVLISIVGTLITDNLTDNFGIPLITTTLIFGAVLAVIFAAWFFSEKTLSIHSIYTKKREAFYWLAILFTFAFGTAAGDLAAETLNLGYLISAGMFAGIIVLIIFAYKKTNFNAVLAFWIAYILTRPLGASLGDYLSQGHESGGIGLGTVGTSVIFLVAILITVTYLSLTKKDVA